MEDLLNVREAARAVRRSPWWIRQQVHLGRLVALRPGGPLGKMLFRLSDVRRLLDPGSTEARGAG